MPTQPTLQLGPVEPQFLQELEKLTEDKVVERLWEGDWTLWSDSAEGISNRLGWLRIAEQMTDELPRLHRFREDLLRRQIRDVVLIGMGGSSLGAEVLRAWFEQPNDSPRLHVLDSTVPSQVAELHARIDLPGTLFLIASKSGTTIEVLALLEYFWHAVSEMAGASDGPRGAHFIAITDPQSPLERLARERQFSSVFENPPNLGGRFSVLSYFGLVPGAAIGVPLVDLLRGAREAAQQCTPETPIDRNPGARLGAALGAAARLGRNLLTVRGDSAVTAFGAWLEQLIAESTGKDGAGILPIVGEPTASPQSYRVDRLFLRLQADESSDPRSEALQQAGHPVISTTLASSNDLGSQFFLWQFATAVAAHLLGVNPFNQPDVEGSKSETRRLLNDPREVGEGRTPTTDEADTHPFTTETLQGKSFCALTAFVRQTPEIDAQFTRLRQTLLQHVGIASTLGYGPRFLHSTGQFHKGGPNAGLFIQFVETTNQPLQLDGLNYSLADLAEGQASGDLQALRQRGRGAIRVDLGTEPLTNLTHFVDSALESLR